MYLLTLVSVQDLKFSLGIKTKIQLFVGPQIKISFQHLHPRFLIQYRTSIAISDMRTQNNAKVMTNFMTANKDTIINVIFFNKVGNQFVFRVKL